MYEMNRDWMLDAVCAARGPWDIAIVGGGATGLGCAVDAATRGYRTVLFERGDFASGTSSRSTKLIHGGVRYLRQGNVRLVVEALREKRTLERNAPDMVTPLEFVIPTYKRWERPWYRAGLGLYDLLARRDAGARALSPGQTRAALPAVKADGLLGGLLFRDAQFDDARLALALGHTAASHGALVVNHCPVVDLLHSSGRVRGVCVEDRETGATMEVPARAVINATGVYVDGVRHLENRDLPAIVRPSRGSHVVIARDFLPGDRAMLVPHTDDGRVIFAIPWLGSVVVGTTDIPVNAIPGEPKPARDEIEFLLSHLSRYLESSVGRPDVRSTFSGLRPLIARGEGHTSALSRSHHVSVSRGGLVTVSGGKWTTYRRMAEDALQHAVRIGGLEKRQCRTDRVEIAGYAPPTGTVTSEGVRDVVLHDMARTVDDVLARRYRTLFLDARAAIEAAPMVAGVVAELLGHDDTWRREETERFIAHAENYLP